MRCDVCRKQHRTMIGRDDTDVRLCNACFERLDQLDRDHVGPAFLFAAAIVANRDAARSEGIS